MDYFLLDYDLDGPYCSLSGEPDGLRLRPPSVGERSASWWPAEAPFKMSNSVPAIAVGDFIDNAFSYLMISARTKALFEEMVPDPIEYLPFKIVNHKGAELKETFYVANVLAVVPAVDMARSEPRTDDLFPAYCDQLGDLHLDLAKIPPESRLFRLAPMPQKILMHQALKEEIERRELTGMVFAEPTGLVSLS